MSVQLLVSVTVSVAAHFCVMTVWQFLYKIEWPVIVPACLIASAVCGAYATAWWLGQLIISTDGASNRRMAIRVIGRVAVVLLAGFLFLWWTIERYHPNGIHSPAEPWLFNLPDVCILILMVAGSWSLSVLIARRQRCGEGLILRCGSALPPVDVSTTASLRHESPQQALDWLLTKPLSVVVVLLSLCFVTLLGGIMLGSRSASRPLDAMTMLLMLMPSLAGMMSGGLLGGLVSDIKKQHMLGAMATLPVSDASLGRVYVGRLFRTALRSWGCSFIPGACLAACLFYGGETRLFPDFDRWWLTRQAGLLAIPAAALASFAGTWAIAGLQGSVMVTGRVRLITLLYAAIIGGGLLLVTIHGGLVPASSQQLFRNVTAVSLSGLIVASAIWVFTAAERSRLLRRDDVILALICWLFEIVLCWTILPVEFVQRLAISGLLVLTVLPIASAPLALTLSRHR